MNDKPRLRYFDAIPIGEGEETAILLRDPEELFGQPLAVPLAMFFILTLLDGTRDLRDVQAEVQRQFQQLLPVEVIAGIVNDLDEFYLLDNERAMIRREDMMRDYARLSVRPAAHAGISYPDEAKELTSTLDAYFAALGASPNGTSRAAAPRGLVVPHIDIRRGGECMAAAFNELRVAEPPALYMILGVAHQQTPNLYTLTEKDFETPLGTVEVDKRAASRLKEIYGAARLEGDYVHRFEHSIEFPTVFLKYLHRDEHPFTILPILCGSMQEDLEDGGRSPSLRPEVVEFRSALIKLMEEFGPRACIIASVDLSHVGKKFGEAKGVDDFRAELIRAGDLRMMEQVTARDAEGFFDHFRPDRNARNVDAVSAVYTMLGALGPGEGRLLKYEQELQPETESLVSFASAVLY